MADRRPSHAAAWDEGEALAAQRLAHFAAAAAQAAAQHQQHGAGLLWVS